MEVPVDAAYDGADAAGDTEDLELVDDSGSECPLSSVSEHGTIIVAGGAEGCDPVCAAIAPDPCEEVAHRFVIDETGHAVAM